MNIFFHDIILQGLAVHQIGSKALGEGINLSDNTIDLAIEVKPLLLNYFLDPFKDVLPFYSFQKDIPNEVLEIAESIFDNPPSLFEGSCSLLKHQYDRALHPKIKRGEVYVTYFRNVKFDGQYIDAIGIFKSERKETYLKVYQNNQSNLEVGKDQGINIKKLDKGCLIYNTNSDNGYAVQLIDKTSAKSEIANFWKDDFLQVELVEDDFFHTNNYLEMCKSFCDEVLSPENETAKSEQLLTMSKSLDFFCEEPSFSEEKFEKEVLQSDEVIQNFQEYKEEYEEKNEVKLEPTFHIHKEQAEQTRKKFRSIIKLDKNFHIYIHGDQDMIKRGFDSLKQQNFYKVYFNNEA
ncbi:nucleoid-associated protein [Cyclobacteriaceae bacterium]|nr:nucleoid-associated protein [Cyclobacteriaceae bacterium]